MAKSKRQLKNLIIDPKAQSNLGFCFILYGFLVSGGFCVLYYVWSSRLILELTHRAEINSQTLAVVSDFYSSIFNLSTSLFVFLGIVIVLTLFFGIVVSHRVHGPIVAIENTLKSFSEGNLEARIRTRKYDDLKKLTATLNEFLDDMSKKVK